MSKKSPKRLFNIDNEAEIFYPSEKVLMTERRKQMNRGIPIYALTKNRRIGYSQFNPSPYIMRFKLAC